MDKHTSLLLTIYLIAITLGFAGALVIFGVVSPVHAQGHYCASAACQLLQQPMQLAAFFIISGALLGLGTILLSRGLHRLFFPSNP